MSSTYKVKSGDSLYTIAYKFYNDAEKYNLILKANKDKFNGSIILEDGMSLVIPDIEGEVISSSSQSSSFYDKKVVSPETKGERFLSDEISCYITNLNTGTTIDFCISPESITETNTSNFEDEQVRGRSSPFKGYSSSGPRDYNFTITLYSDYCPKGLRSTVNCIRALCYPHTINSVIVAPKCLFHLGSFINAVVVPLSVNIEWKKPYKEDIYSFAEVTFSLSSVEDISRSSKGVEVDG